MKQTRKFISLSLIFLLTMYLVLLLSPQVIFANKLNYKSFTIYSHYKLDKNIFTILDSAESLINKSECTPAIQLKTDIYLSMKL